jgi:cell division transport system ATP-binding protein
MMNLISLKGVTVIYGNGAKGVSSVSLDINAGEFVFIVGMSGSGKSTLIRLLLKEVKPAAGEVYVGGTDIKKIKPSRLPYYRRKMGVVFQDFRLLPNKTVYENVAFAMRVTEAPTREIKRNVPAVLTMVGLQKKAKAYPNQLSGGEAQRCALARAIVNKPPLLLADEPTGNLDPDTAWEIMCLLEDINLRGTTIVVATHAKDIVDGMQKRVITLNKGRVIRDIDQGGYDDEA